MTLFPEKSWWRGAFLYQIYPRSFLDTNGDGTGDLHGITEKLPYIKDLGVDGVWISPFFKSPMKDFGYDVSDYRDVDPIFGSLQDFDALLKKAHSLDLKIIIDLVLSHTSEEHPWFQESRQNKTNPKADWYVWSDPSDSLPPSGGGLGWGGHHRNKTLDTADTPSPPHPNLPPNSGKEPNNWVSLFGGPAWTFDEIRGQYYLHNFLKEQPDLNFHNPEVQQEILNTARFWLERGVDGFRLDVVNFFFHDPQMRDNPPREKGAQFATQFEGEDPYSEQQHIYDKSRPENLAFLKKFRALMDQYPDRMTVGEIGDDHPNERAAEYTHGEEFLNTCYNTAMMGGAQKELTASLIRKPIEEFAAYPDSWPSWAFSNHDVVRAASRWHKGDGFTQDPKLSKMLIALLGCLRGTVFLYQGEELGLPEAKLKFEDLRDPWGKHLWPKWQGRDGCRTPMPWDAVKPAKSWLPVPDSHLPLNIEAQAKDPASTLNFTKEFIRQRKSIPALMYGAIKFNNTGDEKILSFTRMHEDEKILCTFNFENYEFSIEKIS